MIEVITKKSVNSLICFLSKILLNGLCTDQESGFAENKSVFIIEYMDKKNYIYYFTAFFKILDWY